MWWNEEFFFLLYKKTKVSKRMYGRGLDNGGKKK